jgi:DNA-binding response OmpR family regulator
MNESRTILVVDDDAECGATLEFALQSMPDVRVKLTTSAESALALLESTEISAVVTDLHLPKMTGLEMITSIRRQAHFRDLPILVVSAATDPSTPELAIGAGATAFFAKPFSPSAVRQRLRQLLEQMPASDHQETNHA